MNALVALSCSSAGLPSVSDTLSLLSQFAPTSGHERIPLAQAFDRVLAEDATASLTMPPCDRSAMDGYAFRFSETGPLRPVGAAPAGAPWRGAMRSGECIAIATGGALPEGCDTVALLEHCTETTSGILVSAKGPGANIRWRGEDFRAGDVLLKAGARLNARRLSLLAAGGLDHLAVRPRLRIAILSIGDELCHGTEDGIRDANRPMLLAICARLGFTISDIGILPDDRVRLRDTLAQVAMTHDAIILSAGTSAGDGDHVHDALLDCGGQLLVSGVAIRPGKPVSFGSIGQTPVIALPGNPAAACITFLVLGLPLLRRLSGETEAADPWRPICAGFNHRKKPGMREYLRVRLTRMPDGSLHAQACRDNGPAMLSSLAQADGLVMLAEDVTEVLAGDKVPFASFAELGPA